MKVIFQFDETKKLILDNCLNQYQLNEIVVIDKTFYSIERKIHNIEKSSVIITLNRVYNLEKK